MNHTPSVDISGGIHFRGHVIDENANRAVVSKSTVVLRLLRFGKAGDHWKSAAKGEGAVERPG